MKNSHALGLAAGISVLSLVAAGTAVAVASSASRTVSVCVTKGYVVRSASSAGRCPSHTTKRSIDVKGPQGPRGAAGPAGSARAWGVVNAYGPVLVVASSTVAGVARTAGNSTGAYCVKFTSSIPQAELDSAVVSGAYAGSVVQNYTSDNPDACPGGLWIWITEPDTISPASHDGEFTFMVP